jgi:hypothetical protein
MSQAYGFWGEQKCYKNGISLHVFGERVPLKNRTSEFSKESCLEDLIRAVGSVNIVTTDFNPWRKDIKINLRTVGSAHNE